MIHVFEMSNALKELDEGTAYLSKIKMTYSLNSAIKEIIEGKSYLSKYNGNTLMVQSLKEIETGKSYLSKYKNCVSNNKKLKDKDYIQFGIFIDQVFDNLSMKEVFGYWYKYCIQVGSNNKLKMVEWISYISNVMHR